MKFKQFKRPALRKAVMEAMKAAIDPLPFTV